jgi:ABC-type transport system involved in multi-copper enzyme maturation permease subunit
MEANEYATNVSLSTRHIIANPNLWSQFLGEVFKWRRHTLYRWFVASPFIFVMVVALGLAFSPARPNYVNVDNYELVTLTLPAYPLGTVGAFAITGQMLMAGYLPLFTIGFVMVSGWCVYCEYNWRTIKMIASRQPNRVHVVLSKVLFVAVLSVASFVTLTLSWLGLAMFTKLLYHAPLGITTTDIDVITLGINHLLLRCLAMFVWALPTMAAVYVVKAATGGVVIFIVYSGAETFLSNLGATAINTPQAYAGADGSFLTILEIAKSAYPYLLTSNLNRITMVANNPQVVASLPVAVSWIALGVYVVVFVAITLWIFVPRDIKE